MWLHKLLVLVIILIVKCNCEDAGDSYRLPNNSKPLRYELWLRVNIEEGLTQFFGNVKVHVKILENSRVVTLHSKNLHVNEINLYKTLIHRKLLFNYKSSRDFLNIFLPSDTKKGSEIVLDISYSGQIGKSDSLGSRGFSMGQYKDVNNKPTHYIFTHFEPIHARECLPCYDEPSIRSIFSVKIEHHSSFEALSNMPMKLRDKVNDSFVITSFHDTPPMQTYLLAFFIHKFVYIQTNDLVLPQRIFTRPALINNRRIKFAAENLDKILKAFEEFFDMPFSLPKIDHVIAPHFITAVENWGLIGYAEHYLDNDSEILFMRIFFHELAHNYFGNLVSPKSFNFLWLNEGFARFYENEIAKIVFPENLLPIEALIFESLMSAFSNDKFAVNSLNYQANNPEEIENKFNSVTYNKGAAIIRMFVDAIGSDTWTKGIKNYLKIHQYSSVDINDLYDALQESIDEDYGKNKFDIEKLMSSWVDQPNYPVVSVEKSGTKIIFTQKVSSSELIQKSYTYSIPITYTTSSNPNFENKTTKFWLTNESHEINDMTSDWIIVNLQQTGFYTVKYDENLTNAIIEQFVKNHTEIHRTNRIWFLISIYDDCKDQKISGNQILTLLSYLKFETNRLAIFSAFKVIQSLLWNFNEINGNFINLQIYFKDTVAKIYKDLKGFRIIKNIACQLKIQECGEDRLNEIISKINNDVSASTDYCLGMEFANETIFDYFLNIFKSLSQSESKTNLLLGLRCTTDENLFFKLLSTLLDRDYKFVEKQVYASLMIGQLNSKSKGNAFFKFLNESFDEIVKISPKLLMIIIESVIYQFTTQEDCNKLLIFQRRLYDYHGINTNICKPKIFTSTRYEKEIADFFSNNKILN